MIGLASGLGTLAMALVGCVSCEPPLAAEAIRQMEMQHAKPIPPEILARNTQRKAVGLRELQTGWQIVPTKHFVCDGPMFQVVVDEQHQPIMILSHFGDRGIGPVLQELEVRDGALNGRSATWWGEPPLLYETAVYRQNRREGATVYFGTNGLELARCEYNADKPWTGRMVQRHGFAPVLWDVGYRDGKLDGAETAYEPDGTTNRLRTFRAGTEHGLSRTYHQGVLRTEALYENGRIVSRRSWHPNGQLEWTADGDDDRGRPHGRHTHYKPTGEMDIDWNHDHGDRHGRWWEDGHPETWFWHGVLLGPDAAGQLEFEKRKAAEAKQ
jgi:antitoxin component YwqK of YwqJK toxin-antitoxin module